MYIHLCEADKEILSKQKKTNNPTGPDIFSLPIWDKLVAVNGLFS